MRQCEIGGGVPNVIDSKVGTLKRKRQLRSVLEGMDSGYVDDIFDSTPMKKKLKSVSVNSICKSFTCSKVLYCT